MTPSNDVLANYLSNQLNDASRARTAASLLRAIYAWLRERDASIDQILIEYEGSGDSGQIETIEGVRDGDLALELPASLFTLPGPRTWNPQTKSFDCNDPKPATVEQALDHLGWDLAYGAHPGFEINDGGRGAITITHNPEDPSEIKVTLDHKEFYTQSTDYCDEF